jgi:hypothetical protein
MNKNCPSAVQCLHIMKPSMYHVQSAPSLNKCRFQFRRRNCWKHRSLRCNSQRKFCANEGAAQDPKLPYSSAELKFDRLKFHRETQLIIKLYKNPQKPTCFNNQQLCILLTECIYGFCMSLREKRLFYKTGLTNWCLLWWSVVFSLR